MLKYSISTNFSKDEPEEGILTLAAAGFHYGELAFEHSYKLVARSKDYQATGEAFRKFAAEHGVSVEQGHMLFPEVDLAEQDESKRILMIEHWKNEIELFAGIGIRSGVLHPGGDAALFAGLPLEKIQETRFDTLRQLLDHARGTGLTLCLENVVTGHYMSVSEQLMEIMNAFHSDQLGICLDTGHLNYRKTEEHGHFIRVCGKYLKALHLHDNFGRGDDHRFPYQGTVNWAEIRDALQEIGYDRLYNLEVPGESGPVRKLPSISALRLRYGHDLLVQIFG